MKPKRNVNDICERHLLESRWAQGISGRPLYDAQTVLNIRAA